MFWILLVIFIFFLLVRKLWLECVWFVGILCDICFDNYKFLVKIKILYIFSILFLELKNVWNKFGLWLVFLNFSFNSYIVYCDLLKLMYVFVYMLFFVKVVELIYWFLFFFVYG